MQTIGNTPVDGEVRAVASGTLPSGQPVVVNADGTVSVVEGSSVTGGAGTPVVFNNSGETPFSSAVFDSSNNKVVIAYMDGGNSQYGTAVVGTVSGSSISFGTPVVFQSAQSQYNFAVYDTTNNKIVIAYKYSNTQGRAIVGTVSGTSISFGSPTAFTTSEVDNTVSAVYDPDAQKVIIAWRDQGNSSYCATVVGAVSGTSISFGTKVIADSTNTNYTALAYDTTNNKVVLFYTPYLVTTYTFRHGYAVVGTVSGTSISWGSAVRVDTNNTDGYDIAYISAVFDPVAEKTVLSYRGNLSYGESRVGTVSGTSISFGAIAVFKSTTVYYTSIVFDSASNSPTIFYRNQTLQTGEFVKGTVSGTSISFDDSVTFTSNNIDWISAAADSSNNKFVVSYRDSSNSNYGTAVVANNAFTSTNLTSENYIGMSQGAIEVESGTQAIGSPAVFESASSVDIGSAYDASTQKVVIAYRDGGNSNYGTAVVGTVSGTSITFGTPVVYQSEVSIRSTLAYDANAQKVVIAFKNGATSASTAIVGTVSGTSISFGSPVVFDSVSSGSFAATYDDNAQKVVIAYMTTNDNGIAIVGTVSGTSISFGSPTQLENSRNSELSIAYDSSAQKVVVAYKDLENSSHGTSVVGTVSGTSISFGTPSVFSASNTYDTSIAYDVNAGKMVISYVDGGNSNYGTAIVGTVSGTSISFGSAVVFESGGNVSYNSIVYDPTAKRVVNFYRGGSSAVGNVIVGNVSGTSISFDTPSQFESGAANHNSTVYDSNTQKVVVAYEDGGNSGYGTSVVFQTGYTNINRGQVADGDSAVIDSACAISNNQLDLTAGQDYYVQTDGTLGLTPATPSVFAGTAVSATKLIVKG